ncbi:MAG: hypothetical protein M3162_03705 [Thermoproteota archaeon]|nr:hypothetical protein [Thermoproteota archaeon]
MAIEALKKDENQQSYCFISIATFISTYSSSAAMAMVSTTITTANDPKTTYYSFAKENNEIVSVLQNKYQVLNPSGNHSIDSNMETNDKICYKPIIDSLKECDPITPLIHQLEK